MGVPNSRVKQALEKAYLPDLARDWQRLTLRLKRVITHHWRRRFGAADQQIIDAYFRSHALRKLQIGSGDNQLPGWLNSDYFPRSPDVLHLDSTQRFPFGDAVFDRVFSEHMIEHVPYAQGSHMLNECWRVLKPGGRIRISTPNLAFLFDLYQAQKSELQQRYIRWATDQFIDAPYYEDTFVINNFMRDWGHQFIYDEKNLRTALSAAGFTGITSCRIGESEDETLRNLENAQRMPEGFLQLETLTLEALKPPAVNV